VSTPTFLVDECLPVEVTYALRQRGFDTADLFDRALRGLDDAAVWTLAATEGRILATRDLDFPLRNLEPRPAGLILLRAPDDSTASQLGALVASLVNSIDASDLAGHITVVSPGRYRQRAW